MRVGTFMLFEDKKETPLNNGQVLVEYENLAPNRTIYYQSINQFCIGGLSNNFLIYK